MPSEEDYVRAREHVPEPSKIKGPCYRVVVPRSCPMPVLPFAEQINVRSESYETVIFEKKLCRLGSTTFWCWCANGRMYF